MITGATKVTNRCAHSLLGDGSAAEGHTGWGLVHVLVVDLVVDLGW